MIQKMNAQSAGSTSKPPHDESIERRHDKALDRVRSHKKSGHPQDAYSLAECARKLQADMGALAPAGITLKRWRKSGALKAATVKRAPPERDVYLYAQVLAIAQRQQQRRAQSRADHDAAISAIKASEGKIGRAEIRDANRLLLRLAEQVQHLERMLTAPAAPRQLVHTEAPAAPGQIPLWTPAAPPGLGIGTSAGDTSTAPPLTHQPSPDLVERLVKAAQGLDSARQSLMLKYDSENAALRAEVEQLRSALKAASGHGPVGLDAMQALKMAVQVSDIRDAVNRLASALLRD